MSRLSREIHEVLSEKVLKKLFEKRICTDIAYLETEATLLESVSGLTFGQVLSVKAAIVSKGAQPPRRAYDYNRVVEEKGAIISSGIKKLDHLLEGGFYTGYMYELCGASSCGKSQLSMSIASSVTSKYSKMNVLYVDTKGDLSAERLVSVIESQVESVGEAMTRILHTKPKDAYELVSCLHNYIDNVKETRVWLIIVDSLADLFYQIENYQESVALLSTVSSLLQYIAVELHTVILVTNLSTSWAGSDAEEVQKPALGKFWAHIPTTRFSVTRLSLAGSEILLTVTKSSCIPIGSSITLSITESGVH